MELFFLKLEQTLTDIVFGCEEIEEESPQISVQDMNQDNQTVKLAEHSKMDFLFLKLEQTLMDLLSGCEEADEETTQTFVQSKNQDNQIANTELLEKGKTLYNTQQFLAFQGFIQTQTVSQDLIQQQENFKNFAWRRDSNYDACGDFNEQILELIKDDFQVKNGKYIQFGLKNYMDIIENIQIIFFRLGNLQWSILWKIIKGKILKDIFQFDTKD